MVSIKNKQIKSKQIIEALNMNADSSRVRVLSSFFKTGKGQYGYGDIFVGITVPKIRKVAEQFAGVSLLELSKLITHKIHEYRLCALHILGYKMKQIERKYKKLSIDFDVSDSEYIDIFDFYIKYLVHVNNWDLVDSSAHYILGPYFYSTNSKQLHPILLKWAQSNNMWERRIAIISTFYGIKICPQISRTNNISRTGNAPHTNSNINSYIGNTNNQTSQILLWPTFEIARLLMTDTEDLIHKAVGWMLREAGKKDENMLRVFLDEYSSIMPRTMLRYALEKFSKKDRNHYMTQRHSK